jgi:hypothetical protein
MHSLCSLLTTQKYMFRMHTCLHYMLCVHLTNNTHMHVCVCVCVYKPVQSNFHGADNLCTCIFTHTHVLHTFRDRLTIWIHTVLMDTHGVENHDAVDLMRIHTYMHFTRFTSSQGPHTPSQDLHTTALICMFIRSLTLCIRIA